MNESENERPGDVSSQPAGCARHEQTAGLAADGASGAPPTNRAPGNCKVLRYGIDSLYLSYPGQIRAEIVPALERAREQAQSRNEFEQAKARVSLLDHLFEVKDKGSKLFRYVIEDGSYRIQLSRSSSKRTPVAYCKISSQCLTALGVEQAVSQLGLILTALADLHGEPNVSRADLFADFTTTYAIDSWERDAWVCRAKYLGTHSIGDVFSGWSIGQGDLLARLYDKTLEIRSSGKTYLLALWQQAGWASPQRVYRLEYQFRNLVLKELSVGPYSSLLPNCAAVWRYATAAWLRLTIPNPDDSTKSRWPNHPLWDDLAQAWGEGEDGARVPLVKDRAPSEEALFRNFLAPLSSYMAITGMTDPLIASERLYRETSAYFDSFFFMTGEDFLAVARGRAARKAKEFNVPYPDIPSIDAEAIQAAAREAYLKATGRD